MVSRTPAWCSIGADSIALSSDVDEVNVVVGVSDTFSRRNQNVSTAEAMRAAEEIISEARARGVFTHADAVHRVRLPVRR